MLSLIRRNKVFFAAIAALAVALRIFFVLKFHRVDGDSLIYGDIAKNWLEHGIFGISTAAGPLATYIRLPGYPAFLSAIWAMVGVEHYRAVLIAQIFVDLATCFVVADLARRLANDRAAKTGFVLTAVCPFLLTYVAAPLTETLAIFFAALALDAAVTGQDWLQEQDHGSKYLVPWTVCGIAVSAGILLRPDGGILLAAIGLYLCYLLITAGTAKLVPSSAAVDAARPSSSARPSLSRNLSYLSSRAEPRSGVEGPCVSRASATLPQPSTADAQRTPSRQWRIILVGLIVATVALAPLAPWAIRNWHDFHRFQPLAPRYANAPDEPINWGFERWTKTWMLDFVSVSEIYWNLPDQPIDPALLPRRAFDSADERARTEQIFTSYNDEGRWTPAMDDALAQIARERIRRAPLRYYVWLPAGRIADMWLRPRTELLGINDRWWEFRDDPSGAFWASLLGITNLLCLGFAAYAILRLRQIRYVGLLLLFVVMRSLFLGTLENPEPRYTLECYPVVLALAAAAFARGRTKLGQVLVAPQRRPELP